MTQNQYPLTVTLLLAVLAVAAQLSIAQIPPIEACVAIIVLVAVLAAAAAYFFLRKRRKCPNAPK